MNYALMLVWLLALGSAAAAQSVETAPIRAEDVLCTGLLELRQSAESQGRLDFTVTLEASDTGDPIDVTTHVNLGSPYSVGRINFTGHHGINDSTLRRALMLRERDVFDVGKLRRSLSRLNDIGLAEPLSLEDVVVTRHAEIGTADLTIPLRERRGRWWSLSGPIIPGLGSYQASVSSRLPARGRGIFDASTYYVTLNLLGLARPLLGILPLLSKSPPAIIALERPFLPGQGWLSGFALSPMLSPQATLAHYGRTHLTRGVHAAFDRPLADAFAVPVTRGGDSNSEFVLCVPHKPRLWWLRRGVGMAADLALGALLP